MNIIAIKNGKGSFLYDLVMVCYSYIYDSMYKIDLDIMLTNSISIITTNKRCRVDENISMLIKKEDGEIDKGRGFA